MSSVVDINDIVAWSESLAGFYVSDASQENGRTMPGPIRLREHQKRILRHIFTKDDEGRFPYDTVVYSCPKKSGKTLMGALAGLWFALTQEPPNEIYVCANDFEQAQARVFSKIAYAVRKNPKLPSAKVTQKEVVFGATGTRIIALASEYASAAGSNHGLTLWDELWAYNSRNSERLWDELTPVPTRLNSMRFITTYAGFQGQSDTLWDLYKRGVGKDELADGKGKPIEGLEGLPCFANNKLFVYWDHELRRHPGIVGSVKEYHQTQRQSLRPSAYLRMHQNRWTTDEEIFIEPERWDACVEQSAAPIISSNKRVVWLHVDASTKRDSSAVVGTYYDRELEKVVLANHRIWQPTPDEPLDLEETIERYILECFTKMRVAGVSYDPFQFHRSATTLRKRNLPMVEFPQTQPNLTAASQQLYELLEYNNLVMYPSVELRKQALDAVAIEKSRGWRIAKDKTSNKIDAIVSLAASAYFTVKQGAYAIDKPLVLESAFADDSPARLPGEENLPWMFREA